MPKQDIPGEVKKNKKREKKKLPQITSSNFISILNSRLKKFRDLVELSALSSESKSILIGNSFTL